MSGAAIDYCEPRVGSHYEKLMDGIVYNIHKNEPPRQRCAAPSEKAAGRRAPVGVAALETMTGKQQQRSEAADYGDDDDLRPPVSQSGSDPVLSLSLCSSAGCFGTSFLSSLVAPLFSLVSTPAAAHARAVRSQFASAV